MKKLFVILSFLCFTQLLIGQGQFELFVNNHYNNSLKNYRTILKNQGVYGYGIGVKYFLSDAESKFKFSVGLEYNRTGYQVAYTRDESFFDISLLGIWGPGPYEYREKVYHGYWSLRYEMSYFFTEYWYTGWSLSVDYPRSEKEIQTTESASNKEVYEENGTISYWKAGSIGGGVFVGRRFKSKGALMFDVALDFKVYTLWAYQREQYYLPHYEYQYPYTLGLRTGILF